MKRHVPILALALSGAVTLQGADRALSSVADDLDRVRRLIQAAQSAAVDSAVPLHS